MEIYKWLIEPSIKLLHHEFNQPLKNIYIYKHMEIYINIYIFKQSIASWPI